MLKNKRSHQKVFLDTRSISNDSYLNHSDVENATLQKLIAQIGTKLEALRNDIAAIKKSVTSDSKVSRKNKKLRQDRGSRSTSFKNGLRVAYIAKKSRCKTRTYHCCKRDHGRSFVSCVVRKKSEREQIREKKNGSNQLMLEYLQTFLEYFDEKYYKRSECLTQPFGKKYGDSNVSLYKLKPPGTRNVVFPVFNGGDQSLDSYLTNIANVSSSSSPPSSSSSSSSNQQNPMCIEWMRLESFKSYPIHTNVRPIRLAQAGFFYTENTDKVQCYSCGKCYSGWQNNDDPIQIHIRISPSCLHVNGGDSNNVPIRYTEDVVATVPPLATQANRQNMNIPQVNGQRHDNSVEVSRSGASDSTSEKNQGASSSTNQEISIGNEREMEARDLENTRNDSVPMTAPTNVLNGNRQSQTQRKEQEPLPNRDLTKKERSAVAKERLHPLGISFNKPRYPNYAVLATRISTFQTWPSELTQSPREMGVAGFFYAGYSDYARCFFCGGGLRNWESGDDPWVEHARWFPKCSYLNQNKGDDFVALIQQQQAELELVTASSANGRENGASNDSSSTPDNTENSDRNMFSSPAVLSVLEMGYEQDVVQKAIDEVKKRKSTDTISAADLMDAILEIEDGVLMAEGNKTTDIVSGRRGNDVTAKEENNISELDDAESLETQSLMEENRRLKEQKLCKICLDQDACIAMLPCGHLCCCSSCAPAMRKCPICREFVKGTVRTWLA